MNPRYLAYCHAHGLEPAAMLAFDRERAPGGHMGPFLRWMSNRWAEWRRAYGRQASWPVCGTDHEDFNRWLDEQTAARLSFVRLLAAHHALGVHFIDLLCAASDDLDPEQEAAFIAVCVSGDLDRPAPEPARAKARRPRGAPGQGSLF
jgi:hypothetical protein